MLNEELTIGAWGVGGGERIGMTKELLTAAFCIATGLCVAGAGTHLYQWLAKQQAMLRYDGKTFVNSMGNLAMSFVCGPYIMLQMGWRQEEGGTISTTSALVSAVVAFSWAFLTGLMFLGVYVLTRF
jgi:hypothetical protein